VNLVRQGDRMSLLEGIRYEEDGPVARITLDRPHAHNAMSIPMVRSVHNLLTDISRRDDLRVVELTGSGHRFFCPGADLDRGDDSDSETETENRDPVDVRLLRIPVLLHEMPQVTLAAVNGACAGAGLGWACGCDLRVAAAGARFNTAFLDVGVAGDMGLPWSLSRIVGGARARELFFIRGKFDAAKALEMGLVSAVYPDDQFRQETAAVVTRLKHASPAALRCMKSNFVAAERMSFGDFVDLESQRHLGLVAQPEFAERARAFVQRRGQ
jgi:2-(1,2-epoxy-1,2-dihydrophenyl)acetyl-CoA isomerase